MTHVILSRGAEYGTLYPAHIVEHNQALAVPQNPLYSLENMLKSRIGLSTLANLIREEYVRISTTEKKQRLLSKDPVQTYSSTLTPKYDIPIDNHFIKNSNEKFVPLNTEFHPMGQYLKKDVEER